MDITQDGGNPAVANSFFGPMDDPANPVPSVITNNYDKNNPPAPVSTAQSWWNKIKEYDQEAGAWLIGVVKDDYNILKGGVTQVVGDIAAPIKAETNDLYWKIILAVVVVGAVVYFAGKSGAVKANFSL